MCRTSSFCPVSLIVLLFLFMFQTCTRYLEFLKKMGEGVFGSAPIPHTFLTTFHIFSYIFTLIHHLFPYTQEAVILLLQINVLGLLPICRGIKM